VGTSRSTDLTGARSSEGVDALSQTLWQPTRFLSNSFDSLIPPFTLSNPLTARVSGVVAVLGEASLRDSAWLSGLALE
jgi:hypothetical protein